MRKISKIAQKRIVLVLLSGLVCLCIGLCLAMALSPEEKPVVENRKAELYDAARIPEVPSSGGVNINTASSAQLRSLPGIGETLSERIVVYREENGAFPHPASIMEVEGLGEKTYAQIQDLICVK